MLTARQPHLGQGINVNHQRYDNINHTRKTFFKYIRDKEQDKSVGPLRKSTGRLVGDEGEMADLLNSFLLHHLPKNNEGNYQSLRVFISKVSKGFWRPK